VSVPPLPVTVLIPDTVPPTPVVPVPDRSSVIAALRAL
jgi:hypothetical protein